jgi:hypothetical protein
LVGEKVGRDEKDFSFTFHWPPSFGFTFTFLLFLFKRRTWIIGASSSSDIIFNSILRILAPANFLKRKKTISFGSGGMEGKYNGNIVIVLEEWR